MRNLLCVATIVIFGQGVGAAAQNVVPNADFDSGVTGWRDGSLYEADGSPSAPSYLVVSPSNNQHAAYSECFALDPTAAYSFSAEARVIGPGSYVFGSMQLMIYEDAACSTLSGPGYIPLGELTGFNGNTWTTLTLEGPLQPKTVGLPINVQSGAIILIANSGYDPANILFDHIVLEPEYVFSSGFESP